LYNQGLFTSDIANTTTRPALSPVIELLAKRKAGTISAGDSAIQIDAYKQQDVRNDFSKYVYQKKFAPTVCAVTNWRIAWSIIQTGLGYDQNRE